MVNKLKIPRPPFAIEIEIIEKQTCGSVIAISLVSMARMKARRAIIKDRSRVRINLF